MKSNTDTSASNPNIISSSKSAVHQDYYEPHYYKDPGFPVIFHRDIKYSTELFIPHWHQNPEILYFAEGRAEIAIGTDRVCAESGDIIIIPSNALHSIDSAETVSYYCLIPDLEFCKSFGISPEDIDFTHQIHDEALNAKMDTIIDEFRRRDNYYKPTILSEIISLLSYTARHHSVVSVPVEKAQTAKFEIVKKALMYINGHYSEELTLDAIAGHVGVTRYYFCHVFKQLTNMTPVNYLNYIRCRRAKELIAQNGFSVGRAAEECGFSNLSYFTRTYKKYNGCPPSHDMRNEE